MPHASVAYRFAPFQLWAALVVTLGSPAFPDEALRIGDPMPEEIIANWERRQAETQTLHCEFYWRKFCPAGSLNLFPEDLEKYGLIPEKDTWIDNTCRMWLDFGGRRVRVEYEGQLFARREEYVDLAPLLMIRLYEGDLGQELCPPDKNVVWKELNQRYSGIKEQAPNPEYPPLFFQPASHPVSFGLGLVPDRAHRPRDRRRLTPALSSQTLRAYKIAALGRDAEGRRLVTFRSPPYGSRGQYFNEFEVDLDRDCVITRWSGYIHGTLHREHRIQPIETERGWMPESWTYATFAADGNLTQSSECRVTVREFNPDLSGVVFHVNPEPGKSYWDGRTRKTYLKSPPGQPDVELGTALALQARQRGRWRSYALVGGLLAVIIVGLWLRHRQQAS